MSLLSQLLKKVGAKSIDELSPMDKETYSSWESVLNGRQVTEKEVRTFLDVELENAIASLVSKELGEHDDTFLKVKIDFIRKVTQFLDAPEREKKEVENMINNVQ